MRPTRFPNQRPSNHNPTYRPAIVEQADSSDTDRYASTSKQGRVHADRAVRNLLFPASALHEASSSVSSPWTKQAITDYYRDLSGGRHSANTSSGGSLCLSPEDITCLVREKVKQWQKYAHSVHLGEKAKLGQWVDLVLDKTKQPSNKALANLTNDICRLLPPSQSNWFVEWLSIWLPKAEDLLSIDISNIVNGVARLRLAANSVLHGQIGERVTRWLLEMDEPQAVGMANTVNGLAQLGLGNNPQVVQHVGQWMLKWLPYVHHPLAIGIANTVNGAAKLGLGNSPEVVREIGRWVIQWLPEAKNPHAVTFANTVNGLAQLGLGNSPEVTLQIELWVTKWLSQTQHPHAIEIANTVNGLAQLGMRNCPQVTEEVVQWVAKWLPYIQHPQAIDIANTVNGLAQLGLGNRLEFTRQIGLWLAKWLPHIQKTQAIEIANTVNGSAQLRLGDSPEVARQIRLWLAKWLLQASNPRAIEIANTVNGSAQLGLGNSPEVARQIGLWVAKWLSQAPNPQAIQMTNTINGLAQLGLGNSPEVARQIELWVIKWLPQIQKPQANDIANTVNGLAQLGLDNSPEVVRQTGQWVVKWLPQVQKPQAIDIANTINGLGQLGLGNSPEVARQIGLWVAKWLPQATNPQAIQITNTINGLAKLGLGRDLLVHDTAQQWVANWFAQFKEMPKAASSAILQSTDSNYFRSQYSPLLLCRLLESLPACFAWQTNQQVPALMLLEIERLYRIWREKVDPLQLDAFQHMQLYRNLLFWQFDNALCSELEQVLDNASAAPTRPTPSKWERSVASKLAAWLAEQGISYELKAQMVLPRSEYVVDLLLLANNKHIVIECMGEIYHQPVEPVRDCFVSTCAVALVKIWAKDWIDAGADLPLHIQEQLAVLLASNEGKAAKQQTSTNVNTPKQIPPAAVLASFLPSFQSKPHNPPSHQTGELSTVSKQTTLTATQKRRQARKLAKIKSTTSTTNIGGSAASQKANLAASKQTFRFVLSSLAKVAGMLVITFLSWPLIQRLIAYPSSQPTKQNP